MYHFNAYTNKYNRLIKALTLSTQILDSRIQTVQLNKSTVSGQIAVYPTAEDFKQTQILKQKHMEQLELGNLAAKQFAHDPLALKREESEQFLSNIIDLPPKKELTSQLELLRKQKKQYVFLIEQVKSKIESIRAGRQWVSDRIVWLHKFVGIKDEELFYPNQIELFKHVIDKCIGFLYPFVMRVVESRFVPDREMFENIRLLLYMCVFMRTLINEDMKHANYDPITTQSRFHHWTEKYWSPNGVVTFFPHERHVDIATLSYVYQYVTLLRTNSESSTKIVRNDPVIMFLMYILPMKYQPHNARDIMARLIYLVKKLNSEGANSFWNNEPRIGEINTDFSVVPMLIYIYVFFMLGVYSTTMPMVPEMSKLEKLLNVYVTKESPTIQTKRLLLSFFGDNDTFFTAAFASKEFIIEMLRDHDNFFTQTSHDWISYRDRIRKVCIDIRIKDNYALDKEVLAKINEEIIKLKEDMANYGGTLRIPYGFYAMIIDNTSILAYSEDPTNNKNPGKKRAETIEDKLKKFKDMIANGKLDENSKKVKHLFPPATSFPPEIQIRRPRYKSDLTVREATEIVWDNIQRILSYCLSDDVSANERRLMDHHKIMPFQYMDFLFDLRFGVVVGYLFNMTLQQELDLVDLLIKFYGERIGESKMQTRVILCPAASTVIRNVALVLEDIKKYTFSHLPANFANAHHLAVYQRTKLICDEQIMYHRFMYYLVFCPICHFVNTIHNSGIEVGKPFQSCYFANCIVGFSRTRSLYGRQTKTFCERNGLNITSMCQKTEVRYLSLFNRAVRTDGKLFIGCPLCGIIHNISRYTFNNERGFVCTTCSITNNYKPVFYNQLVSPATDEMIEQFKPKNKYTYNIVIQYNPQKASMLANEQHVPSFVDINDLTITIHTYVIDDLPVVDPSLPRIRKRKLKN